MEVSLSGKKDPISHLIGMDMETEYRKAFGDNWRWNFEERRYQEVNAGSKKGGLASAASDQGAKIS